MGVCRRAALYLARKKGKSLLLFLVFFAVSALLLLCVSVLEGTGQAARELRSSVGASFTIRPYAQMTLEEGEITQAAAPVVSQESIDQILAAAQGIASLLRESAHQMGKCVVVVTHSRELAREADVVFRLKRGTLVTA